MQISDPKHHILFLFQLKGIFFHNFSLFLTRIIFKVFIEFVTIFLLFYVLVFWLWGMWNPSSPTRDWTWNPHMGRLLDHQKVPKRTFFIWTCQHRASLVYSFFLIHLPGKAGLFPRPFFIFFFKSNLAWRILTTWMWGWTDPANLLMLGVWLNIALELSGHSS